MLPTQTVKPVAQEQSWAFCFATANGGGRSAKCGVEALLPRLRGILRHTSAIYERFS